jgi:4-amino-4-deoxy-L-arabinose transferase-like glycosyltransferase
MTSTLPPPPAGRGTPTTPGGAVAPPPPAAGAGPAGRSRLQRLARGAVRGRPADPAWARPALLALLAATAALYLWGLSASGWANSYYSAAVQAGTQSWSAFFFGASDAAGSITVDKPPAAQWVMGLSARLFGVNSWSILVPQALEGVAAVALLAAAVRRVAGAGAGLLAGLVLAITPVATLMFRFDNPDALLVLLLVAAAYATTRALETASARWLALAGALVGFGFLTKMLQALLVVPALALVHLVAAPTSLRRRLGHLVLAGLALVASAGWYVAVVSLVPASSRPYIGGSQTNSILELTLGYNGLGRLTGEEAGSVGGRAGQGGRWGQTGWTRLFDGAYGGQASWLIPGALVLLVAGLWLTRRAPRTDRLRAALLLWGGWLLVTGLVFSFMQGIVHEYYTVALAPAIGGLVGLGAAALWRARERLVPRVALAAAVLVTTVWTLVLLGRASGWHTWLRPVVGMLGVVAALALVAGPLLAGRSPAGQAATRRAAPVVAALALVAVLAAPAAASVATAATPHAGAIVTAQPATQAAGPGGMRTRGLLPPGAAPGGQLGQVGQAPGAVPGQLPGGAVGLPGRAPGARAGGLGGLLDAGTPSAELVTALRTDASRYTWVAAAVGSNSAAGLQLATGLPVMPIGGFNGSDPSPTLEQFQRYVAEDKIHYFLGGGGPGGMQADGGADSAAEIAAWVQETYQATTIGGVTVYDLTS